MPVLEALLAAISGCPLTPDTTAIINALDESADSKNSAGSRLRVMAKLLRLAKLSPGRVRIVALSRLELAIEKRFRNCPQIQMDDHNQADISAIVGNGIQSIRKA